MLEDSLRKKLLNLLTEGELRLNEPMKQHTTFKIGGNADYMMIPKTEDEIINIIKFCSKNNVPLLLIGNGSNMIVRDGGIRGVVMKIYSNYSQIFVEDNRITAQAGAILTKIASVALENRLSGMEFASGIPGTLGGAVVMNAGAYGGEMKNIVISTTYADELGNIHTISGDEHEFGYRHSFLQKKEYTVLKSVLELNYADYDEIKAQMLELNKKRKEKQPLNYPSAGSIFKRPEGYFTGKLIEDCGLKGYSIGGAQVSELHAGFIINKGGATCKNAVDLIKYIQETVKMRFGVELETEVLIVGED